MAKIKWFVSMVLYRILGSERAVSVEIFFDALLHCHDHYDEAMEYRVRLFSQQCLYCRQPHPTDANFCPNCGQKILSEEEQIAVAWAEEKAERETLVADEEAAAWAEHRQPEMVYH